MENTHPENNPANVPADDAAAKRSEKIQNFKLELTLDDDLAAAEETVAPLPTRSDVPDEAATAPTEEQPAAEGDLPAKKPKRKKKSGGCLKKIIYAFVVAALSVTLAWFVIIFLIDSVALNRSDKPIDIEIPAGANTKQIAAILEENGIIEHPICFRLFSKITRADGKFQQGAFSLTANMGYATVVDVLQTMTPRETATVTIPEGFTIEEIAKLLDEKGICKKENFYSAVISNEYDYDFVKAIPTAADGKEYAGRIYLLEGYLFPDTYNFYLDSSGETVVKRMLENFNTKLTPDIRSAIAARGYTIDEAIIIASIIQGEAAKVEDMKGVSKVLFNRMEPNSGYPKLQCDSTGDYVREILPSIGGIEVTSSAYDTYEKEGLPVGAINNPGMDAIEALLNPSTDSAVKDCYFFATDYDTGITYFSKTYAQHEKTCRKYKIGMYG